MYNDILLKRCEGKKAAYFIVFPLDLNPFTLKTQLSLITYFFSQRWALLLFLRFRAICE